MRSPTELESRLRAEGRRVTEQRRHIIGAIHGTTEHPTAETIWSDIRRDLPDVSLRTVYQTLNDLVDMGEIQSLDLGTGAARFDPNTEPHHHLVCRACGHTHDLDAGVADATLSVDQLHGYEIEHTEIVFRGRCPTCSAGVVTSPATVEMR